MPFVTEEVWSWWQEGSVHHAIWPKPEELTDGLAGSGDPELLGDIASALEVIRGAKSSAKRSMKTVIVAITIAGPAESITRLQGIEADLRAVGRIAADITWQPGAASISAEVQLEPEPQP